MHAFASAVILTYAAILIAGGIVGWRMSGSRISFTVGLASAALLAASYRLSHGHPSGGYLMAAVVSLVLAVLFAWRFRKTRRFLPSGMISLISMAACILLGWITAFFW